MGISRKLLHIFPTFNVGGSQVRFAQIANALEGLHHDIVTLDGHLEAQALLESTTSHKVHKPPHIGNSIKRFASYRRKIKELKPDLLLTYNWGSIEWALANFAPLCKHIHIVDGFGPEEAHTQLRRRVLFRRLAFLHNTDVIVPSRTLYEIATKTWKLPSKIVHYVPNGIETKRFETSGDQELIASLNLPKDRPIIGTIAALRAEKNLSRLVSSFALAHKEHSSHLLIIGDGPERLPLERMVEELCLTEHVTFSGYLKQPERLLAALDIFALSSDTEQMPYSVLEAMASGLPVASVNAGDVENMVSKENQPYICHKDARALADNLSTFIKSPDLREKLGASNVTKVKETFEAENMIETYRKFFNS